MSQDDAISSNKLLLRHATVLQKARSFLPPSTGGENQTGDFSNGMKEDEQWPEAMDELSGLGATPTKVSDDAQTDRKLLTANEKLRKQLLGRTVMRSEMKGLNASKPKPRSITQRQGEESEDDEEGRSKLGKRKSGKFEKKVGSLPSNQEQKDNDDSMASHLSTGDATSKSKRPISYLDQLLAERQKKRKKQKRKGDT